MPDLQRYVDGPKHEEECVMTYGTVWLIQVLIGPRVQEPQLAADLDHVVVIHRRV